MGYINPYNFVPLSDAVNRKSGHPGFLKLHPHHFSGKLKCRLIAVRDLLTLGKKTASLSHAGGNLYEFCKNAAQQPIIRGTSIKGMLRAVYEALQNGCMCRVQCVRGKGDSNDYHYVMPPDHESASCCDIEHLCPACRMFGRMGADTTCKGRISFSDAVLEDGMRLVSDKRSLKVLAEPKPRHNPTYGQNGAMGDPIAGRKFYYHHELNAVWHEKANKRTNVTVSEYAPRGSCFSFTATIENLNEAEVCALVAAIELKTGLAHKIGLGKAIGLGSCKILIIDSQSFLFEGRERYRASPTPFNSIDTFRDPSYSFPGALAELLRLNKPDEQKEGLVIGYSKNYKSYPSGRINKRGVLGGPGSALPGNPGNDDQIPSKSESQGMKDSKDPPAGTGVQKSTTAQKNRWPKAVISYDKGQGTIVASFEGKKTAPLKLAEEEIEKRWPGLLAQLKKKKKTTYAAATVSQLGNRIDLVDIEK